MAMKRRDKLMRAQAEKRKEIDLWLSGDMITSPATV